MCDYQKFVPDCYVRVCGEGSYLKYGRECRVVEGLHYDTKMRRYGVTVVPLSGPDSSSRFLLEAEILQVIDYPLIVIGGHRVIFNYAAKTIKVGCTTVLFSQIEEVYKETRRPHENCPV